jgi:hypothetical protein
MTWKRGELGMSSGTAEPGAPAAGVPTAVTQVSRELFVEMKISQRALLSKLESGVVIETKNNSKDSIEERERLLYLVGMVITGRSNTGRT